MKARQPGNDCIAECKILAKGDVCRRTFRHV